MSRVRMNPPCYPKCDKRQMYCHSKCDEYKQWRAALDAENDKRHKNDEVNDYTVRLVNKITGRTRRK